MGKEHLPLYLKNFRTITFSVNSNEINISGKIFTLNQINDLIHKLYYSREVYVYDETLRDVLVNKEILSPIGTVRSHCKKGRNYDLFLKELNNVNKTEKK